MGLFLLSFAISSVMYTRLIRGHPSWLQRLMIKWLLVIMKVFSTINFTYFKLLKPVWLLHTVHNNNNMNSTAPTLHKKQKFLKLMRSDQEIPMIIWSSLSPRRRWGQWSVSRLSPCQNVMRKFIFFTIFSSIFLWGDRSRRSNRTRWVHLRRGQLMQSSDSSRQTSRRSCTRRKELKRWLCVPQQPRKVR